MSFHNDGQFPVSHTALKAILGRYDIPDFSYAVATSGIENTTCIIDAPQQKYALRIYRQAKKSHNAMQLELDFMESMRAKGYPVPQIYSNVNQQQITQISIDGKTWDALLMQYMSGSHPVTYSHLLLSQMASAQATMHMCGERMAQAKKLSSQLTTLVEGEFVRRINQSNLSQQLRDYIARIMQYEVRLDPALPCGYSHFDFDKGNVLTDDKGNLSAILDFDDLQYAPLVICLGYTLWSVLYETGDDSLVEQYLEDYQKLRALTPLERAFLPQVMLFRHYVITALKILNGHTTEADIQKYESIEHHLKNWSAQ